MKRFRRAFALCEGYFLNNDVVRNETGWIIRITPKGIKETIGKGNRFQYLPKKVKKQKVATLRMLPDLIRNGSLLEDNVCNYYSKDGEKFAYLRGKILLDEEVHNVRIAVKKKINTNYFYIHHIDTEKSSELLSPSIKTDNYEIQNL